MGHSPRDMPAGTDGQAHLFFRGDQAPQIMAVSTSGCVAVQISENPIRVFKWHFRMKGSEIITIDPTPWAIVWSCRAPWNSEPCGELTRLHIDRCELTAVDVRGLNNLAHLRCAGNCLETLDCSGMKQLTSLDCSGNQLASVDVDGCSRLLRLRVGGNPHLRQSASDLLATAHGEPRTVRRQLLTSTSLFDL